MTRQATQQVFVQTANERSPEMYDPYRPAVTDNWDWPAQVAIWRSRAIHQAERAAKFQALAEALQKGDTITLSDEKPRL